ncbi:MAG TPA: anthranilate synthase component I family protein [Verrucomicrobiae bacterium]|nr:anthranilate synthase component I family protein [Verrucomicrobiae bacterium]
MRYIVQVISTAHTPESLIEQLRGFLRRSAAGAGEAGLVLLRSALFDSPQTRYSFLAARPFLTFRSFGSRCEVTHYESRITQHVQFGNPWHLLDTLMARFELLDEIDLPFPLGGCFGYWGYDLKNFVEPKLPRRTVNDLELPDCHVGFYDSLVVFDHRLGKTWIVSTGLCADGSRDEARARGQAEFWREVLASDSSLQYPESETTPLAWRITSNLARADFLAAVAHAQRYIRAGDIYQVNLSQRLMTGCPLSGWELFERLRDVSPAPFAAYFDCGDFQIATSSPELFLRMSGPNIQTRPIKGTRPRSPDPTRDAQLAYELQTSPKELAELLMITDLLRNDLGKVCEFGSVHVPELMRLERFPQVQHLVSTVEGRLRPVVTHFVALASCFPGGSITGAPKFRAMQIIDELEPIARGPYTGCHGYLGFNRESQLSISIRTAIHKEGVAYFQVGAGIVADSIPAAEYDETLSKAGGFLAALRWQARNEIVPSPSEFLTPP